MGRTIFFFFLLVLSCEIFPILYSAEQNVLSATREQNAAARRPAIQWIINMLDFQPYF